MSDLLDRVRDHYDAVGLKDRLKAALRALGPDDQPLTIDDLAGVDQFHTRGLAATADLAELAGVGPDDRVLDVGSGLGGPARLLAQTYGCQVTGIDLSAPFVEAAGYLSARTGQEGRTRFQVASALALPFDGGAFDLALLQHVAMNIADRAGLYREIRRVLRPQGRLAIFDVVSRGGQPDYPTPWARTSAESFLLTAEATRQAAEEAGFRTVAERDDTGLAKAWIGRLWEAGPPPPPNLGVVMGPDFPQLAANLGRALLDGRVGVLSAVFEAA
jgi:ubiquinone/menaquinone biosynthesis C-methylase UbiE